MTVLARFFRPNITATGRAVRAAIGLACLGRAWANLDAGWPGTLPWLLAGIFALSEAYRGWCIGRACGLKTPL